MRLTDKAEALAHTDDTNDGSSDWTCTACGNDQKGSWHHCSGCHLTFPQSAGFDRHKVGKFENRATGQPNTRRCLTVEEMVDDGWQQDPQTGVWRMPAPKRQGTTKLVAGESA